MGVPTPPELGERSLSVVEIGPATRARGPTSATSRGGFDTLGA